jgi:hypothetical protein
MAETSKQDTHGRQWARIERPRGSPSSPRGLGTTVCKRRGESPTQKTLKKSGTHKAPEVRESPGGLVTQQPQQKNDPKEQR